jgi:acid phosphatase class B
MKIGFDYWQVLSHYQKEFSFMLSAFISEGAEVCVISAVGQSGKHTRQSVVEAIEKLGYPFTADNIHVVVFDHPVMSPEMKVEKAKELGINMFFDDRDDVCRAMNKAGILGLRVTRKDNSTYDLEADLK